MQPPKADTPAGVIVVPATDLEPLAAVRASLLAQYEDTLTEPMPPAIAALLDRLR